MKQLQNIIQARLNQLVNDGIERGTQVALYYRGELVVDAFAGVANIETGAKVTNETLFPVFSTTKGMVATIIHRLAERGLLEYDQPIAEMWPEFAAHGKEAITIRQSLNHTSGLPLVPLGVGVEEINNWDLMCRKLADSSPVSAPNERTQYHAITYGWILGEVACRATRRTFPQLWHDELCAPLGTEAEMFCGLPAECEPSVAYLEEPNPPIHESPAEPTPEAVPFWVWPLSAWMNRPEAHRACIPASNGIMTARAIAKHYAALLPGGVDGVELLPPSRIQTILSPQPPRQFAEEGDEGFSMGYGKFGAVAFGHDGYGGSVGIGSPSQGWAFAFTRNRLSDHESFQPLLDESLKLLNL